MTVSAEILRQLHRIHRQRSDLLDRLERGPKQVDARRGSVKALQAEVEAAQERLLKTRKAARERQRQLDDRESRVHELQGKLNACGSNKEFQSLKEQIAADEQANSVLSDEILELLEKADQIEQEIQRTQQGVSTAESELQKTIERVDTERQMLENELSRVNDDLGLVEAKLSGDFRVEYERLAKARGPGALAPVEDGCCGGCNQTITHQTINNLMMNRPTFCPSCGSLLYLPE